MARGRCRAPVPFGLFTGPQTRDGERFQAGVLAIMSGLGVGVWAREEKGWWWLRYLDRK